MQGLLQGQKVCAGRGPMAKRCSAFGARTGRALRNCLRAGRWQSDGAPLAGILRGGMPRGDPMVCQWRGAAGGRALPREGAQPLVRGVPMGKWLTSATLPVRWRGVEMGAYISFTLIFLRILRLKSRGPPKKRISDWVIGSPCARRSSMRYKVQTRSAS